jgi:16S rRNA processing protein RimM
MPNEAFFKLGNILKTFGNQGHLLARLDTDDPGIIQNLESVYLEIHGERIPFFISSFQLKPNLRALLLFEDVKDVDTAAKLTGAGIFIPLSALPELPDEEFYYHEIIGFTVEDKTLGKIGNLNNIIEYPQQELLQIINGEKEILIPLVDEIVLGVDRKLRTIFIDAPEGLISLYL